MKYPGALVPGILSYGYWVSKGGVVVESGKFLPVLKVIATLLFAGDTLT